MKKLSALFSTLLLVFGLTAADSTPDIAGEPSLAPITVTGKLIDTKCYGMDHGNHNNDHMVKGHDGKMMKMPGCATACGNMGIPVGLLEKGKPDGQVYILVTPAGQLASHAAKEARITGEQPYKGAIIPTKIEVKNESGAWEEVTIATMM